MIAIYAGELSHRLRKRISSRLGPDPLKMILSDKSIVNGTPMIND